MIETFKNLKWLRRKYLTVSDLLEFLKGNKLPAGIETIRRWEEYKIIPEAKRVMLRGTEWRVYKKDGSDFIRILRMLDKVTTKRVGIK